MKTYRVLVNMIEYGYVDVEAESENEALEKAGDEVDAGAFRGANSECQIIDVER